MNTVDVPGKPVLWIVIPCYNEEAVIRQTAPMFLAEENSLIASGKVSKLSKILFVNDGSTDNTWSIIQELSVQDEHYIGISLSRNRGHQNAVLAGLIEARDSCDITISIDCDGQDDIFAMTSMVEKYLAGAEVVYGVRSNRDSDSFFKRCTAESFYKLLNWMGAEVVYNHADYRLISSKALSAFSEFEEVNLYLRGLIPLVGFNSDTVYYERHERIAGKSHYTFGKMLHLAFDGITSLSIKPISIITGIGLIVSLIGFIGTVWAIVMSIVKNTVPGWASIICIISFLGGIQLLSLGVIGQYIGKIYLETKKRPRYIISEKTWVNSERKYKG